MYWIVDDEVFEARISVGYTRFAVLRIRGFEDLVASYLVRCNLGVISLSECPGGSEGRQTCCGYQRSRPGSPPFEDSGVDDSHWGRRRAEAFLGSGFNINNESGLALDEPGLAIDEPSMAQLARAIA
uniref:Uncharacterized protein n=1 Tax=Timema bartmani TaxID=61472 RepID=A0A7R9F5D3_9NEOP|nr:unnamed protein product [Timema bartmani]